VFRYVKHDLHVERVPVSAIAQKTGTPVYIYSRKQVLSGYRSYRRAFSGIPHLICYALKANSNLSILALLAGEGSGADIVSGGELYRALKAGMNPSRIVFAGAGKTDNEIKSAIKKRILAIHAESEQELFLINSIAGRLKTVAPVSLRVNPDIDPQTHPYISTGLKKHKFGIPIERTLELFSLASSLPDIELHGLHMHLGSQIRAVEPFREALEKVLHMVDLLEARGIRIRHLDAGGGLGINYEQPDSGADPEALASVIKPLFRGRNLLLIIEPGRSIVASAGLLLTKILYTKENYGKHFVIVDAAMNDLIRPSLYNAYHSIVPVHENHRSVRTVDVVGPVCETGDFFARDRDLSECGPGELLAILHAGAYGFSMSSNYNSRVRPAEVLVAGNDFYVIRKREQYSDLIRGEL